MSLTELQAPGLACRLQLHGAALAGQVLARAGRTRNTRHARSDWKLHALDLETRERIRSSLRTLTWPRFVVFRGDQRHSYKNVGTELAIAYSVVAFSPG